MPAHAHVKDYTFIVLIKLSIVISQNFIMRNLAFVAVILCESSSFCLLSVPFTAVQSFQLSNKNY